MTVQDLIDLLSDFDPDSEVRLAHQPGWPFEYWIGEVVSMSDIDPAENMTVDECNGKWFVESVEDERTLSDGFDTSAAAMAELLRLADEKKDDVEKVVYISEAGQIGYLPGEASRALGWR